MIRAIIFDCFGVLTEDGWLTYLNKYVDEADRDQAKVLNHQNDLGMLEYKDFLRKLGELSGVEVSVADGLIRRNHTRNIALMELITVLKRTYKLGILSNISSNYFQEFLTKEDLALFNALSLSGESGHLKPEPAAYNDICMKLEIKPSEGVFIDDREPFVEGAKRFGLQSFVYTNIHQLKRDLQSSRVIV